MQAKEIVYPLTIFFIFLGLFIAGAGITGMVVTDTTMKPLCETNADCSENAVCCKFYEAESGVCEAAESCDLIYDLTKREKETEKSYLDVPKPQKDQKNTTMLIAGILITFISLYILYLIMKEPAKAVRKRKAAHR